jgi:hypothetical protein
MSKHTPGEWEFVENENPHETHPYIIRMPSVRKTSLGADKYGVILGGYDQTMIGEVKANARLIAAAPTLLEALKIMVQHAESAGWEDSHEGILGQAQEAIKRAEGGEG